ncbi:uncharacterized protein [Littorina saxatilis]|uniref:uncharacterized protein n=1 Tax=Littorina saxatilis TaxID=31220 RepID=UPI0038B5903B
MPPKRRAAAGVASATAKLRRPTRGPIRAQAQPVDVAPLGARQQPAAPPAAAPDPALVQAVTQAVLQALVAQESAAELPEDPVMNVIDNAVTDITGTYPPVTLGQSHFISSSSPVTATISGKLKDQIWQGQFIDLHDQLEDPANEPPLFAFDPTSPTGLYLQKRPKMKPQMDPTTWTLAWNRFSAIVTARRPEIAPGLAHHMEVVVKMAGKRGDWSFYDAQFRRLIERGEAIWGTTHLELYMNATMASHPTSLGLTNSLPRTSQQVPIPSGACFSFHKSGECSAGTQCSYQHQCFNAGCRAFHPITHCPKPVTHPFSILPRFSNNRGRGNRSQEFQFGSQPQQSFQPRFSRPAHDT